MGNLEREIVWLNHDNEIKLILKSCGSAVDLSASTKIALAFSSYVFISDNDTSSALSWNQAGYDTGELHIHLGKFTSIAPGVYDARVVVYDISSTDGIVWGDTIPLAVRSGVLTT